MQLIFVADNIIRVDGSFDSRKISSEVVYQYSSPFATFPRSFRIIPLLRYRLT